MGGGLRVSSAGESLRKRFCANFLRLRIVFSIKYVVFGTDVPAILSKAVTLHPF
jgi:hypothetical protein